MLFSKQTAVLGVSVLSLIISLYAVHEVGSGPRIGLVDLPTISRYYVQRYAMDKSTDEAIQEFSPIADRAIKTVETKHHVVLLSQNVILHADNYTDEVIELMEKEIKGKA